MRDGDGWETSVAQAFQTIFYTGNQFAAYSGDGGQRDRPENSFRHPHIGIAIIDVQSMKLVQQRYRWNDEHAFAHPSLASNPNGEVAITFMWGGAQHHVQHGVGFLTGQTELSSTTNDQGLEGDSHYITARMAFPEIDRFIGAGWNSPKDTTKPGGRRDEPRYVLFER